MNYNCRECWEEFAGNALASNAKKIFQLQRAMAARELQS